MSRRDRLVNFLDRTLLSSLMLTIAFVLEKALDRMVAKKPGDERSEMGKKLVRGVVSDTADLQHHHPHRAPQA